ncbi:MAG: hypothetical protein IT374_25650, partial [Polyangiaceae bacterium]|nr:hypothetical protein [Polyangiaceae bacterium]
VPVIPPDSASSQATANVAATAHRLTPSRNFLFKFIPKISNEVQSHDQVRDAVGMFQMARDPSEGQRWSALVAWSRAARAGLLVAEAPTTGGTLRDAAARLAQVIAGYGPRGDDRVARVFGGALRATWRGPAHAALRTPRRGRCRAG